MAEQTSQTEEIEDASSFIEKRNHLLKDVTPAIMQKAWATLGHLILEEGAKVVDMGCGDGEMTYAMSVLYPWMHFVGVDKDKRSINRAKTKYELFNLEFIAGDASKELFDPNSIDAIINSDVLHEIYSTSRYNEHIVGETLETQFKMLKTGGLMFIRDYSRPPPEEFVLLEMPDVPSEGQSISGKSDADLLVWYSEHARPRHDPGTGGFFLEELPQRSPGTRLFRLPHKWAYEFIMRKDDRAQWEKELPMEYTFFTPREFRKELRRFGARVQYTGPHWDEDYIEENFEGRFRLFDDYSKPLGYPPTSFVAVACKMAERKSLHIHERRPSQTEESTLTINAMRNQKTGEIVDVVSRKTSYSEIIPYRVNSDGRLKIYLHDGVPRNLVNSVPRGSESFDGRRWSGHMLEPISIENEIIGNPKDLEDIKNAALMARDYIGLKPNNNAVFEPGPDYFPSPDYIDDKIDTFYLSVNKAKGPITPKGLSEERERFLAKGSIREMDAQQVLDAISVGFIPNAHLELQILHLFNHLNLKAENWTTKQVTFQAGKIKQKTHLAGIIDNYGIDKQRFKDVKGTAGQLRSVHSIFVEEGQARGSTTGLSAQNMDFVVHNDRTVNTAVVLPLTKGLKQDVHAGFILKQMPVPQRHTGNANIISAPSFNLPRDVTNLKHAKKFIAEQYGVLPEMVIKMGESYFTHVGMTTHRIHPFAVFVPPGKPKDPGTQFLPFYQFMLLRRSISRESHFMIAITRAYKYFHEDIKRDFALRVKDVLEERFKDEKPDWSIPLSFEPSPMPKGKAKPDIMEPDDEPKVAPAAPKPEAPKAPEVAQEATPDTAPEAPAPTSTAPVKPSTENAPDLAGEFSEEVAEFIEALEQVPEYKPQPEKW